MVRPRAASLRSTSRFDRKRFGGCVAFSKCFSYQRVRSRQSSSVSRAGPSAASDRCENADCRLLFSRVGLLYHGATRLVSRTLSRVSRTFSEATCSTSAPSPPD